MGKITKKRKEALSSYDREAIYSLNEACEIVKKITKTKFDSSVDLDVKLGVDPRQANQMVRGTASLPHGIGKEVRVLALVTPRQKFFSLSEVILNQQGLSILITQSIARNCIR